MSLQKLLIEARGKLTSLKDETESEKMYAKEYGGLRPSYYIDQEQKKKELENKIAELQRQIEEGTTQKTEDVLGNNYTPPHLDVDYNTSSGAGSTPSAQKNPNKVVGLDNNDIPNLDEYFKEEEYPEEQDDGPIPLVRNKSEENKTRTSIHFPEDHNNEADTATLDSQEQKENTSPVSLDPFSQKYSTAVNNAHFAGNTKVTKALMNSYEDPNKRELTEALIKVTLDDKMENRTKLEDGLIRAIDNGSDTLRKALVAIINGDKIESHLSEEEREEMHEQWVSDAKEKLAKQKSDASELNGANALQYVNIRIDEIIEELSNPNNTNAKILLDEMLDLKAMRIAMTEEDSKAEGYNISSPVIPWEEPSNQVVVKLEEDSNNYDDDDDFDTDGIYPDPKNNPYEPEGYDDLATLNAVIEASFKEASNNAIQAAEGQRYDAELEYAIALSMQESGTPPTGDIATFYID